MTSFRVARRYARAIITLAEEKNKLETVAADFERLRSLVKSSNDLELFILNPTIGKAKKRETFSELFSSLVDELTMRFLLLLVSKGREPILLEIIDEYNAMVDEKTGIVRAEVYSFIEMNKKQAQQLQKQLEGFTGKTVSITYSLDRNLKGGFLARLGDTVFDASVRRQLEMLEEKFMSDGSVTN